MLFVFVIELIAARYVENR